MKALGIMSGTSLDGIDVVLAEITGSYKNTKIKELAFKTYPLTIKNSLLTLLKDEISIKALTEANFIVSNAYSEAIKDLLSIHDLVSQDISFIASHGQTIFHSPKTHSTLQIGDGSVIANLTGITTVFNFRTADMALGGQGAPLVPYMDYCLFSNEQENRVLLNIGGIANITYLKKRGTIDEVIAFDTGPGNMMIDYMMEHFFKRTYDDKGSVARSGQVIDPLLKELLNTKYIQAPFPKSTGRELFGKHLCEKILKAYPNKKEDIISTLTHFTAHSIIKGIQDVTKESVEVIASGGGAHNTYLMELISKHYPKLTTTDTYGIGIDSKEALAFIMLGNETLKKKPSNVKSATGAKKDVILGQIAYAGGKRD